MNKAKKIKKIKKIYIKPIDVVGNMVYKCKYPR